jgi:hypothetical protein
MKITRRQLKRLIETYQGLVGGPESEEDEKEVFVFDTTDQNQLGLATTGEDDESLSVASKQKVGKNVKAPADKQKSAIGRSVKGKRFTLKADRIFGTKTFPDSNVYLIPIAGSEKEVSGLAFNYEPEDSRRDYSFSKSIKKRPESEGYWSDPKPKKLSDVEMNIFQNRRIDFDSARHQVYDLSTEGINILSNLGVSVSEIEGTENTIKAQELFAAGLDILDDKDIEGIKDIEDIEEVSEKILLKISEETGLSIEKLDQIQAQMKSNGNTAKLVSVPGIDLENDIVFVPSLTGTSKNFAGLPRMILHALFDSTGDDPNPNSFVDDILRPLYDKINNHLSSLGLTHALDAGIDSSNEEVSKLSILVSKIGTTAAFRNAKIFTSRDMIAEFVVQEITNSSPPAGATYLGSIDKQPQKLEILPKGQRGMTFNNHYFGFLPNGSKQVINRFNSGTELGSRQEGFVENRPDTQSFFLELREDIKKAAAQIRERLKGKIVLINVV